MLRVNEREQSICFRKKQINVSFQYVCPIIDNEFRHNIVKVVMTNSSSTTGQTHEQLTPS